MPAPLTSLPGSAPRPERGRQSARIAGRLRRAVALYEESLALRRAVGDHGASPARSATWALVAQHQGDYARAAALYEESLALYRALDDTDGYRACAHQSGERGI